MKDLNELYDAKYFEERAKDRRRLRAYQEEAARLWLRLGSRGIVAMTYDYPLMLLDWGCGTGEFEDFLPPGWCKYGIEPSDYARAEAEKRGITIINPSDLWRKMQSDGGGYFDLVIFRGTLQHIDEPFFALHLAVYALRAGGLLAILAQPNTDSLVFTLFGELPALDPPRNWWWPGERELVNVMRNLGMKEVEVLHPYWGGPYARPVHDCFCFLQRLMGRRVKFAWPGNMLELYAWKGGKYEKRTRWD